MKVFLICAIVVGAVYCAVVSGMSFYNTAHPLAYTGILFSRHQQIILALMEGIIFGAASAVLAFIATVRIRAMLG
jgi:hypothetical protein